MFDGYLELLWEIFLTGLTMSVVCTLFIGVIWLVLLTLDSDTVKSLRKKFGNNNKPSKSKHKGFSLRKVE